MVLSSRTADLLHTLKYLRSIAARSIAGTQCHCQVHLLAASQYLYVHFIPNTASVQLSVQISAIPATQPIILSCIITQDLCSFCPILVMLRRLV